MAIATITPITIFDLPIYRLYFYGIFAVSCM